MPSSEQVLRRLRALCLALPETSDKTSWGHPNFRVGKKMFVAFEKVRGRPSIAFRLNFTDVDLLLRRKGFFVTPYGRGQWVSVWVDGPVNWRLVRDLVEKSYREVALKRMIAGLESQRGSRRRAAGRRRSRSS